MGRIRSLKPMPRIRVLIVDDHPLFRDGLIQALRHAEDIQIIGTGDNGIEVLTLVNELMPDVILLDVNLPGINGLQVARQLHTQHARIRTIILTAYHDNEQVILAARSGAIAYCAKDILPDQLITIIRDSMQGYCHLNNQRMTLAERDQWLQETIQRSASAAYADLDDHLAPLSPREMEILVMITEGLLNKEIGLRLKISEQTVKNHITSILRKLNVKDRTQAAVTALRRGWVRIEDHTNQ
ncbi:MAG: response regulator transcription factor [Anaerolineae bacterium]|nr:response regulator transcription factor [Anaerolineae bacterium]MDW8172426.1 response regulator transcription factor [Anaerolineae bacterium]